MPRVNLLPSPNAQEYRLFGWEVSPYTAKTRHYLRYKNIPFEDVHANAFALKKNVVKKIGYLVMPVVHTPDGKVLQDSSVILDALEEAHPTPPARQPSPVMAFADSLLEIFGDEWLPLTSLHFRWNNPTNREFAYAEFGRNALPYTPKFIQKIFGRRIGAKMEGYLPALGITPEMAEEIGPVFRDLLVHLEAILHESPYLLGSRPSYGDFAIQGQLYAHPYRDPGTTHLFAEFPKVTDWIERLRNGAPLASEGTLDAIGPTLMNFLRFALNLGMPLWFSATEATQTWFESQDTPPTRVPRGPGKSVLKIGKVEAPRVALSYQQWMLQRVYKKRDLLSEEERTSLREALRIPDCPWFDYEIQYPLAHRGFRIVPE